MNKLKKTVLITCSSIIIFVVLVIVFISPIAKYLIEKYDEKYTGRQITLDWVYVNPFTGYLYFNNLKIHEQKSDSVFFSAKSMVANVAMFKLINNTYEISELTLNHPYGIIIQSKKDFNFNDLIEKFSPKEKRDPTKPPVHFNVLRIKIKNGEFHYRENITPISYFIKKVNCETAGVKWNVDTIVTKFSFQSGTGTGDVKGNCMVNSKSRDYRLAVIIDKFDLKVLEQYLKDLTNYGTFSAQLDAKINAKGNFKNKENIIAKGSLAINNFHFGKNKNDDYAAFEKLEVIINELSPKYRKYLFDSVVLNKPYFKYERYDYLDNVQTMFGKKGSNITSTKADPEQFNLVIEIAKYIKVLSKNFFKSNYKINRLAINDGRLKYNDYSLSEKFAMELDPISFIADSIDKNHQRVNVLFNSGVKPYGDIAIAISINPRDSSDFDINYIFQKLPMAMFNPYAISYTSFPLDRGTIELKGTMHVINGNIKSNNHLVIIDPRTAKRIKNKDAKWIPVPLVMFFIRERGNVIDFEIPITGSLKDPKFNMRDVLFDVLENVFVKPVTTPYRVEVRNVEIEIEKSLRLKWATRASVLTKEQKIFIKQMADFLLEMPEVTIVIRPQSYTIKEKEHILFFEAKKKYYLETTKNRAERFSESDSLKVTKMSIKDTLFVDYLNKRANDALLFTVQDKCAKLIGADILQLKLDQLHAERARTFMFYFKEKQVSDRVKIMNVTDVIPYNGTSFYKMEYKGELPEKLLKAYEKMNELNNTNPRDKFKKQRKKNENIL